MSSQKSPKKDAYGKLKGPPLEKKRSDTPDNEPNNEPDDESIRFFKTILAEYVGTRNTECQLTRSSREAKDDSDLTLDDIMCNFSTAYVPEPVEIEEMKKNGELVNDKPILGEGYNGIIVDSGLFKGNPLIPLITKLTRENSSDFIYEIIVNMIIINKILLSGKALHHLVPTYGLFKCPKKVTSIPNSVKACNLGVGSESYFLVQQKIKGQTLDSFLRISLTLDTVYLLKDKLVQILSTLIILEESEYNLNHNDLHTQNIMIDYSGNAYIIDMGVASFKFRDRFVVQSENQAIYLGNTEPVSLGAICDIHYLFTDIIRTCSRLKDTPLIKLLDSIVNNVLSLFAYDANDGKDGKDGKETKIFSRGLKVDSSTMHYMFKILCKVESNIKDESVQKMVHDHNIDILKSYTTRRIVTEFFPEEYTVAIFNYLKTQGAGHAVSPFKSHKKRKSNKRVRGQRTSRRKAKRGSARARRIKTAL
jgi:hypothetical protein